MSEQEPLLPTATHEVDSRDEAAAKKLERQERLGEFLESRRFHKLILTLVSAADSLSLDDLTRIRPR